MEKFLRVYDNGAPILDHQINDNDEVGIMRGEREIRIDIVAPDAHNGVVMPEAADTGRQEG